MEVQRWQISQRWAWPAKGKVGSRTSACAFLTIALSSGPGCLNACMLSRFSHVWLFATLWTIAPQALLSIGFSRQEYWSRLPCSPPGDLPNPGIVPVSLMSPAVAGRFFGPGCLLVKYPPIIPYLQRSIWSSISWFSTESQNHYSPTALNDLCLHLMVSRGRDRIRTELPQQVYSSSITHTPWHSVFPLRQNLLLISFSCLSTFTHTHHHFWK